MTGVADDDKHVELRQATQDMREIEMAIVSLSEALRTKPIAQENHVLVRRIAEGLGLFDFEVMGSYIKAKRPDGKLQMQVYPGYTTGFSSEDEARQYSLDGHVWESDRNSTWGIDHPVTGGPSSGGGHAKNQVDRVVCPNCTYERALDGSCECDD